MSETNFLAQINPQQAGNKVSRAVGGVPVLGGFLSGLASGDIRGALGSLPLAGAVFRPKEDELFQTAQRVETLRQQDEARKAEQAAAAASEQRTKLDTSSKALRAFDRLTKAQSLTSGRTQTADEKRSLFEKNFLRFIPEDTRGAALEAFDATGGDVEAAIGLLGGEGAGSVKPVTLSAGASLVDPVTGQVISANPKAAKELLPQELALIEARTRAADRSNTGTGTAGAPAQTELTKALDKGIGAGLAKFANEERDVAILNISLLDNAIARLNTEENLSGPKVGLLPKAARRLVNPAASSVQDQALNAIQKSLKATLGAQFARVEGEQLLARAFDPLQPQAENARRLGVVSEFAKQVVSNKDAKIQYARENGTLAGFQGPTLEEQTDQLLKILRGFGPSGSGGDSPGSGGLSADEQAELEALRAELGAQ